MKPHNYKQLNFDKGAKNIWWRKDNLFIKNYWKNWLAVCNHVYHPIPILTQNGSRIHVYHPIPILTQNGSRILTSDPKL
jgi:hypothetical protein